MITEQTIKDILKNIDEPFLNKNFTSLGFVKNVFLRGSELNIELGISDINYDGLEELKKKISDEVKKTLENISNVKIEFTIGILTHKNSRKDSLMPGVKNTIAVASGKGGVGKSTVAVNLAAALSKEGAKVGLIDADIYGPSIPIMLGVNDRPGVIKIGEKNKLKPVEKYGIKLMSIGFLMEEKTAVVWRGPMASSALKQFMGDVLWDELDYLLFDLPPGTGDIQLTLSQTIPLTGAIIVTTPQDISLADAEKGVIMFEKVNVPILGVIENMSYFLNSNGAKEYIFGQGGGNKISKQYDVKLLGEIPINTSIREHSDKGVPIVIGDTESYESKIFHNIATEVIKEINLRNVSSSPTPNVEILI